MASADSTPSPHSPGQTAPSTATGTDGPTPAKAAAAALVLGALGVVFGDIGTSPLYTLRETFTHGSGITPTPRHVLGVLSVLFWAVTSTVTIKYVTLIMRADNKGEGGVLALATLATQGLNGGSQRIRNAIVLFAVIRRRPRQAQHAAIIMIGSTITTELLKHTLPRPFYGFTDLMWTHNTFPSGHTAGSLGIALALLPAGARRSLDDPYEDREAASRRRRLIFWLIVAALAAADLRGELDAGVGHRCLDWGSGAVDARGERDRDVDDRGVEVRGFREREAGFAVCRVVHRVAGLFQTAHDERGDFGIIFDDEHAPVRRLRRRRSMSKSSSSSSSPDLLSSLRFIVTSQPQ